MKIVYCIHSTYNPGGMERTLLNKVRWLWAKGGYEITVVTTDQKGRPPFFEFPHGVKTVDLDINYSDDNGRNPVYARVLPSVESLEACIKNGSHPCSRGKRQISPSRCSPPSRRSFRPLKTGAKRCWNSTSASFSAFSTTEADCWDWPTGSGLGSMNASCAGSTSSWSSPSKMPDTGVPSPT